MTDAADRAAAIQENLTGPKRVQGDEGEVEAQPLKDQIEADKYLGGKSGVDASKTRGFRFMRISPPGGTGV